MPIAIHHPIPREVSPAQTVHKNVLVPLLLPADWKSSSLSEREEEALDILEWLGMLTLRSPRINSGDDIDPYLSRYAVPNSRNPDDSGAAAVAGNMVSVRWHGFIPATWIKKVVGICMSVFSSLL